MRLARGGIAIVADTGFSLQGFNSFLVAKCVIDKAERTLGVELLVITGDNAARFLAPVLKRVKSERYVRRRIVMVINAENSAFIVKFIVIKRHGHYWFGSSSAGSTGARS